jgi:hypothetical protein
MNNQRIHILTLISLTILILSACRNKEPRLLSIKEIPGYPSGSAIEYFNERIYLVGDDASHAMVLNLSLEIIDSILLYHSTQKRIPSEIKADLEAMTLVKNNNTPNLLILGSGSKSHLRDTCWLINPATKEKEKLGLDSFMQRLARRDLTELNIEGVARIPAGLLLVNRGNKSHRVNSLIFTSQAFWQDQSSAPIRLVRVGSNADTSFFNGVSGLDYSTKSDKLFLTASTENTYNTLTDGAIGKSFLWIINDLSSKKRLVAINPSRIIDLEEIDDRFQGHKIESVCLLSENRKETVLLFVSDNDDGKTTVFKVSIPM